MPTPVYLLVIAILVSLAVRNAVITSKRGYRRRDLQHEIEMILDPAGCENAMERYEKCVHLVEYYGVSIQSTKYKKKTLSELRNDAGHSVNRAFERNLTTIAQNTEAIKSVRKENLHNQVRVMSRLRTNS